MKPPKPSPIPYRRFDYDRRLLPNPYLAEFEPEDLDLREAELAELDRLGASKPRTERERKQLVEARIRARERWLRGAELSLGFPAWNLLYFALFCSLPPGVDDPIVIETGTNLGLSTIVMAQALRDVGLDAVVETVERDAELVEQAKLNVERAGLSDHVRFHAEDSLAFLARRADALPRIDFVFLDDSHDYEHVARELDLVCPKVEAGSNGTVYLDNSSRGGVASALRDFMAQQGGHLVRFPNCSALPPGNAIWQPERKAP